MAEKDCNRCGGTGVIYGGYEKRGGETVVVTVDCPACNGTGKGRG